MKSIKVTLSIAVLTALSAGVFAAAPAASSTTTTATAATTAAAAKTTTASSAAVKTDVYSDIQGNWAAPAIRAMSQKGYISGYTDGTFKPSNPVTREQAAAIYAKMLGNTAAASTTTATTAAAPAYKDVATDRWSAPAIKEVTDARIMIGYENDTFDPTHEMTRQEFAVTAANYAKHINFANKNADKKVTFADESSIASWAKASVTQLAQEGVIKGSSTDNFNPERKITRAEAASILYRIVDPEGAAAADSAAAASTSTSAGSVTAATGTETAAQTQLEDKVFKQLNKSYKTPANFQNYGVMYWQGDQLFVALKNAKDRDKLDKNLAALKDSEVDSTVVTEDTRYSQAEYDKLDGEVRTAYKALEPNGSIVSSVPDVPANQLIVTVSQASSTTQKSLDTRFGSRLKLAVQ